MRALPTIHRGLSITLTQLRSFLAVIHGGSVTAAADALVVTQPSVSAAVAALSQELGVALTEREGRGIRATEAGAAFTPYAEDILALLDEGREAVQAAAERNERRLRLAAVTTAAESFVPPLIQAFRASHPEVDLTLDVGNRDHVLKLLLEGETDIALGGRPPNDPRLEAKAILPNELVLVTAPDDRLIGTGPVSADQLERRVWLMREKGSGTRTATEHYLSVSRLAPRTLELGSNGAVKQGARAGIGIALIPRLAVFWEIDSGLLATLELADPPAPRSWYALCAKETPRRRPVKDFMAFAETLSASNTDLGTMSTA